LTEQLTQPFLGASTYSIAFYVGNINDPAHGLGSTSTARVFVNGVDWGSFTDRRGDATHFIWKEFTIVVTATSTRTKLRILNGDDASDGINGLDRITTAELPG
jgi:hypothetical protein